MLLLTNEDVAPLLDMAACIPVMEQAFRDYGLNAATDIPRQDAIVPIARERAVHDLKTMTGSWPGAGIAAIRFNSDIVSWPIVDGAERRVKLPLSQPGGRYNGAVLLFSTETGQLLAMLNDGMMQKTRVGAASGVAAKFLARQDATRLGLLGTGLQAEGQIEAICAVRAITTAKVFSPTPQNCEAFAARFSAKLGIDIRAVGSAEEAAADVDILVSATNSMRPTLRPEWLRPGLHLSTIRRTEIPPALFAQVDRLVVNAREGGRSFLADNCPDVPELKHTDDGSVAGIADIASVPELKDLAAGTIPGRQSATEITCFHNYPGLGLQFAALGSLVYRAALKRKLGLALDDRIFTQTVHP